MIFTPLIYGCVVIALLFCMYLLMWLNVHPYIVILLPLFAALIMVFVQYWWCDL